MKAIILAAGYGTRLYPLTLDTPKPLLLIGKKPVIEFIVDQVQTLPEIDDIFIVTNQKFLPHFRKWSSTYPSSKRMVIVSDGTMSEETKLGAIGDIHFIITQKYLSDDLLVIAGDNLFNFELSGFVHFFKQKNATTIGLYDVKSIDEAKKMGVVEINSQNKLIGFEEKPLHPKSTLISTACYLFSKDDVKEFSMAKHFDRSGDFIATLSKKKPVYGYRIDGTWFDIGSLDQLEEARKVFA